MANIVEEAQKNRPEGRLNIKIGRASVILLNFVYRMPNTQ